jgi:hypothetical protein
MRFSSTIAVIASVALGAVVMACSDNAPTESKSTTPIMKSYPAPTIEAQRTPLPGPSSKHQATLMATPATSNLVLNWSFEDNAYDGATSFTDWSVYNDGSGAYYNWSGTVSPLSGYSVPSPTNGTYAAMSDQYGPGVHIVYQDVTIPAGGADLGFDLFIGNRASDFYMPNTLDFNYYPNQQYRVDIVDPSAGILDLGSAVWANIYITATGDPLVSGYDHYTASLDAFAGQTVRLRFAEIDNSLFFNGGLDAVTVYPKVILDIKPGSTTNPVNIGANGSLPVAILTEPWFDATTIDPATVTLGDNSGTETFINVNSRGRIQYSLEDVDGDGDMDFVAHFSIPTLVSNGDLTSSTTMLYINGADTGGATFFGHDVVSIVP